MGTSRNGTHHLPSSLPANALFTRTQQRVLGILFGQPRRSYRVSDIIEQAGVGSGAVYRELARLEESHLVIGSKEGKEKYYRANRSSAIFDELCSLAKKITCPVDRVRDALEPLRNRLDIAFVYGSVANGEDTATSDIDVMAVCGEAENIELENKIRRALFPIENDLNRRADVLLYARDKFRLQALAEDSFIKRVLERPVIFLQGSRNELNEICRT